MSISAYPLEWPAGWKRTYGCDRVDGRFGKLTKVGDRSWKSHEDITISDATRRVLRELERMGLSRDDVVISTNLKLRLDGLPRSDQRAPEDPGCAVYWQDRKANAPRVMAIDRYNDVEHNLAAIAATLDAMRAIERHGGAMVLERAFTGFTALPAPGDEPWWKILGVDPKAEKLDVELAFRRRRSETHPDKPGGNESDFGKVVRAFQQWEELH